MQISKHSTIRQMFVANCSVFSLALLLPAFATTSQITMENEVIVIHDSIRGISCLLGGIPFVSGFYLAWMANISFTVALIALLNRKLKLASLATLCSLVLASQAPSLIGETLRLGPGGTEEKIVSLSFGFYLWVISLALPMVTVIIKRKTDHLTSIGR